MKVSALCLAGIASGSNKKVPPRHPLQRLGRLVEFTGEIMNSGAFNNKPLRWIQMWELKFANNANRMERNFERGGQRCGFYNPDSEHGGRDRRDAVDNVDRYDREDPCKGMKQILTGFSKWSDRYISECSGQRTMQHQKKRMIKWGGIMNSVTVLNCNGLEIPVEPAPTEAPEPVSENTESYEYEQENDYTLSDSDFVVSAGTYEISNECNANYVDSWGRDCNDWKDWCNWWEEESFIYFGMESDSGLVTALNCPQCGCSEKPIELGKQDEGRSFTPADVSPQSRQ